MHLPLISCNIQNDSGKSQIQGSNGLLILVYHRDLVQQSTVQQVQVINL